MININRWAIRGSIHSGYQESMLGIMKWIRDNSPNKIIQLGTGSGVVTFLMAQYLYDTNPNGKIKAYDWWDDSSDGFHIFSIEDFEFSLKNQPEELQNLIEYEKLDYRKWLESPDTDWDMIYVDLNNDGEKIEKIYDVLKDKVLDEGKVIFFEGGTDGRFNKEAYKGRKKFSEMKDIPYKVYSVGIKSFGVISREFI